MSLKRKTFRRQRDYARDPVSMIVRYDIHTGAWVHAAGLVLTPREVSVLAALATGALSTKQAAAFACCGVSNFDNYVTALKRRFNVGTRKDLLKIAYQLFPSEIERREGNSKSVISVNLCD